MINFDIFNNSKESQLKEINLKKYYIISIFITCIILILITTFKLFISHIIPYQIDESNKIYLILDNKPKNIYINNINYNNKVIMDSSKKNKYNVTIKINGFEVYKRIEIKVEEETTIMKYLINYVRKDLFNERT